MENAVLVSVVVPVYNVSTYLPECLQHLTRQTLMPIEVILVDDGSKDDSPAICDRSAEEYGFIRVIHKENEGVSVARNTGLHMAQGKYVSFVDGDDLVEEDYCERLYRCAEENGADIVVCDYFTFGDSEPKAGSFADSAGKTVAEYKREMILKTLFRGKSDTSAGVTWGKFYRLDYLREIGTEFVPGLVRAQDTVFWLNTVIGTEKLVHLELPLYRYRLNDQSVCGGTRFFPNSREPFGRLLEEYDQFIRRNHLGDEFRQAYYGRVIEVLFWHWKHHYFNAANPAGEADRVNGFCALLRESPYREAIRNVDPAILSRRQKALVFFARAHLERLFVRLYTKYRSMV